jgi:hypothetical protein
MWAFFVDSVHRAGVPWFKVPSYKVGTIRAKRRYW